MRLVKIADETDEGVQYDVYELQASEGEEAAPFARFQEIMDLPGFNEALVPMSGHKIVIVGYGTGGTLHVRTPHYMNSVNHGVGDFVEIGKL